MLRRQRVSRILNVDLRIEYILNNMLSASRMMMFQGTKDKFDSKPNTGLPLLGNEWMTCIPSLFRVPS